jgi:site-specific DNA-methyltransferase (adenine-specific)
MTLLIGDCIEQMKTLGADSVDAIVTDPPYGLEFMGKDWDAPWKGKASREFNDVEPGTLGGFTKLPNHTRVNNVKCQTCDKWKFSSNPCICETPTFPNARLYAASAFQTWTEQWAREALRVLKPGGHLLAFGGTRMYHRLAAGIEDAGFEIRDTLMWLYGSGFPKSLDVSKAIDKAAGAERERVPYSGGIASGQANYGGAGTTHTGTKVGDNAISEAAKKWQGWGTALKPAVEPIVLARKPLIGKVAANVLTHGTGALNIDASRIGTDGENFDNLRGRPITKLSTQRAGEDHKEYKERVFSSPGQQAALEKLKNLGRWPANILLDEEAAAMLDEQSGVQKDGVAVRRNGSAVKNTVYGGGIGSYPVGTPDLGHGGGGGASRFFYVAKASRSERNAGLERNIHPTVKPVALMKYLIRLVVPKGGVVLDPFLGSGTTAVAAIEEGVEWIGCEREPEYLEIIKARVAAAQPGMGLALEEER